MSATPVVLAASRKPCQQRLVVGFRERYETVIADMADQRIGPGKVDVVGDRDQRGRRPVRVEAAGGVGEHERLAAQRAECVDRNPHRVRVAALVVVAATLEESDLPAFYLAHDQTPRRGPRRWV